MKSLSTRAGWNRRSRWRRCCTTLALLRPGQTIRLLLHREPFPLYPLLAERGYRHDTTMQADGSYVILIRPAAAPAGSGEGAR